MENKVVEKKSIKKSSNDNQNLSFQMNRKKFICITSLVGIVLFSIFAYYTVDWSILLLGGIGIFNLFYPLIRGNSIPSNNVKREIFWLGLISIVSCAVLMIAVTDQSEYAKIVVLIMAFVGVKLVFYPIYETEVQE